MLAYLVGSDGKRGILASRIDLPAGATQEIELRTTLSWPDGQVLR